MNLSGFGKWLVLVTASILVPNMIVASASAQELAPLEAYGSLPQISLVVISPDGNRMARRQADSSQDRIVVYDFQESDFINSADADAVNPRSLFFAGNNNLLLIVGRTVRAQKVRGAFDYSAAYDFNLRNGEIHSLMRRAKIFPYQSGLGRVISVDEEDHSVFIPAFRKTRSNEDPSYGIFHYKLDGQTETTVEYGKTDTVDWFMNSRSEALVREDFDQSKDLHQIWRVDSKKDQLLYELETDIPEISLVGMNSDFSALVLLTTNLETNSDQYYHMSIDDGSISEPILERKNTQVSHVIKDLSRVVLGVAYAGFFPSYHFFDEELNARVQSIQAGFPNTSTRLVSWSSDKSKLVFYVEGKWTSGQYLLIDSRQPGEISAIGVARPEIDESRIADVYVHEYEARDGLKIPALVTAMQDIYETGNAPLILMPHGGPSSHDVFGFDWMAQYFASRGYVVLQPQFRGSDGFGPTFELAGRGEWGRKMQSDLDDGVQYLIEKGVVDEDRVCVVGSSYGGYAALAAGAFSPQMYKCIVSLAGVSDLHAMLESERSEHGKDHWVFSYWQDQVGSELADRGFLRSISPVRHAENFQAPVLLLHGKDDTVVLIEQSRKMRKALKKAGKVVVYKELKGEDHWLTQADTRTEALRAMADFIEEHL